ncbi:MAG: hypothetical protein A3F72_04555 [Bacteroidetes bacterium RIFCSPLOWO2_12_FULL_35_15]|nr:MAG: hypothetical protein A3F72_04555 [Bacteroidetes bacterium RIFCSPLOWO2_12_FULL_35_15]
MNFHLQFPITPFPEKIKYSQPFLFLGSCFAENIGETMQDYKFNVKINPHGVLYNPLSITVALRRYMENKEMQENDLFFANDCWNSWEHHSRFSNISKQDCLEEINQNISTTHEDLKKVEWLFITFGSAFVYKRKDTGGLVGNCHKIPQKEFTKHLLTTNEIIVDYNNLIKEVHLINPKLKIVFTISPVRYMRDGALENTRSKARLVEAVHELVDIHANAFYFPAYELVIDDLRDYRFYKTDLVHPNEQAIEYVFEKLMTASFDEETKSLFEKIKELKAAASHRPFNSTTASHKKFKATYLDRCIQLKEKFPYLDLSDEVKRFGV